MEAICSIPWFRAQEELLINHASVCHMYPLFSFFSAVSWLKVLYSDLKTNSLLGVQTIFIFHVWKIFFLTFSIFFF